MKDSAVEGGSAKQRAAAEALLQSHLHRLIMVQQKKQAAHTRLSHSRCLALVRLFTSAIEPHCRRIIMIEGGEGAAMKRETSE